MDKPLDELYFIWLCGQVGSVDEEIHPSRTYWELLKLLFTKEFIWFVDRDENRAEQGRELRREFANEEQLRIHEPGWFEQGCCMLEMMIGLSRELSFHGDGEPRDWFWLLMENLDLERYNDETRIPYARVDKILNELIFRTYRRNGRGGLFPLRKASADQRDRELWQQAHNYLLEAG